MRVLVTGAEGFVGGRLTARLEGRGHEVVAAIRVGTRTAHRGEVREFDLRDGASVERAAGGDFDAVAHLAAVASGGDARRDPALAWEINAAGTARLCEAVAGAGTTPPRVLLVSTAEVYGAAEAGVLDERTALAPVSPYAASKLGAEIAAQEVGRRTGLAVVIARAFPHTGAGQDTRFVVPAFAARIRQAVAEGRREVAVGNLDPVRDFLHVDDVVDAYVALLETGDADGVYNVASGQGVTIREVFERLCRLMDADVRAVTDPDLVRPADIARLVGSADRLQHDTGWRPRRSLDDALLEVARAQAH